MNRDQQSSKNLIVKLRNIINEYPGQFWLLMMATFIDLIGGFLIFPFFSLYFTEKFSVSLTQVGFIYGIWAISGILGRTLGGALADRTGRKRMVIIGLVFSALTSLGMALATDFFWIYITSAIGGLFSTRPPDPKLAPDKAIASNDLLVSSRVRISAVLWNAGGSLSCSIVTVAATVANGNALSARTAKTLRIDAILVSVRTLVPQATLTRKD